MFSSDLKHMIAAKVQKILQETDHYELPDGEVNFILHVDGEDGNSWANIINNRKKERIEIPDCLIKNMSV